MTLRRLNLPDPPDLAQPRYVGQPEVALHDISLWLSQAKVQLENFSRSLGAPAGQRLTVGAFSTNTSVSGTSTGTDLANFVSTLVQAMQNKGYLSPIASRGQDQ